MGPLFLSALIGWRRCTLGQHGVSKPWKPLTVLGLVFLAAIMIAGVLADHCDAQQTQWIWSPAHKQGEVPKGACHFRKSFAVAMPQYGQIAITADDAYELYVNGRTVGQGGGSPEFEERDITRYLTRGRNTVAVRAVNSKGKTAALAARVIIKEQGGRKSVFSTDGSWKTNLQPLPLWKTTLYNDARWDSARAIGVWGKTEVADRVENAVADERGGDEQPPISSEFTVQRIISGDNSGSLIAMTFNEFGQAIVSQEAGPLLLIYDSDGDQQLDKSRVYCETVKDCQGILALNGDVFVTGAGPEGTALYRLADKDRDGKLEDVRAVLKFAGEMGQYGPHGLTLGPDGLIYLTVGSQGRLLCEYDSASPYRDCYEGDLVQPRYEDPSGREPAAKAPGGVIIRTDVDGSAVELVAGGLWNVYDLAFNETGDLFVHDSEAEVEDGAPWRRPAQLYHVIPGAEFGYRSGWAKWPSYYVDATPPLLATDGSSLTGAAFYGHYMFPARYHDTLFVADWSQGRILNVRFKPQGGSYTATSAVFLEDEALRVTDLDVGPDGRLYFVTGGKGNSGGLYCISWKGKPPAAVTDLGAGVGAAIRQPQLHSAWCRQEIARLKIDIGDVWENMLVGVARSDANPWRYRTRALDLLQLFGPLPTGEELVRLSQVKDEHVRAKAAELMGLHATEQTRDALVGLLSDSDGTVRRKACEALARAEQSAPISELTPLLVSDDRFEAWSARRLLERTDPEQWRDLVLEDDNHRLFIQGALALMIAHADRQNSLRALERFSALMVGYISDRDFVDMLRIAHVAILRGGISADDVPELRDQLAEEFPAADTAMNRELGRLLAYLQVSSINDRYLAYLKSDAPHIEKMHLAFLLRFLQSGWTSEQRLELLAFYEEALQWKGASSYPLYVTQVIRDFAQSLTDKELQLVLDMGAEWPNAALAALYRLPQQLDDTQFASLKQLDQRLAQKDDKAAERLKVGIIAVLARSRNERCMSYLREVWEREPERRAMVAFGLAQSPAGENWDYLVRSLPIVEGDAAREVLTQLRAAPAVTDDPEHLRQLIILGLRLKAHGATQAVALLEHWTGKQLSDKDGRWEDALAAWQTWYSETYPDRLEAKLPVVDANAEWDIAELLDYLASEEGKAGSPEKGEIVFEKARCIQCHRYDNRGQGAAPDLATVTERLTKKEILQSIFSPSHMIADQYAAKTPVAAKGRSLAGDSKAGARAETVVAQPSAERDSVAESQIDETVANKTSAMPAGLLNSLSPQEISDLFAYFNQQRLSVARREEQKSRK